MEASTTDQLVAEYDGADHLLRYYADGPGTDEPLVWYEGAAGTGDRRWLIADERGSIAAVTDGSGASLATNTYDEYGLPGSGNLGRFQYTGQAWLPEVGLYDYKARMYSPSLGRFLQPDPIGYADGMNWYIYAHGDPVNGTDPTGLGFLNDLLGSSLITPQQTQTILDGIVVSASLLQYSNSTPALSISAASDSTPHTYPIAPAKPQGATVAGVTVTGHRKPSTQLAPPDPVQVVSNGLPPGIMLSPGISANMSPEDRDKAAEEDEAICRSLSNPSACARCYESANNRHGARSRGLPLPPLITFFLGGGAIVCVLVEPCGASVVTGLGIGALLSAGAQ